MYYDFPKYENSNKKNHNQNPVYYESNVWAQFNTEGSLA